MLFLRMVKYHSILLHVKRYFNCSCETLKYIFILSETRFKKQFPVRDFIGFAHKRDYISLKLLRNNEK